MYSYRFACWPCLSYVCLCFQTRLQLLVNYHFLNSHVVLSCHTIFRSTLVDGVNDAFPITDEIHMNSTNLLVPRLVRHPCRYARRLCSSMLRSADFISSQDQWAIVRLHIRLAYPQMSANGLQHVTVRRSHTASRTHGRSTAARLPQATACGRTHVCITTPACTHTHAHTHMPHLTRVV